MLPTQELYWIAGLLEGEGHFGLRNKKIETPYPTIQLGMCDLDVIEKFRSLIGKKFSIYIRNKKDTNKKHRTQYSVALNGNIAIQWMMTLYPLMGERRKAKIAEVIHIWKNYEYFKPYKIKARGLADMVDINL